MASFLDTNVLLCSISDTPAEAAKRAVAQDLVENGRHVLSTQVLQEFYVQATRPKAAHPLSHELASDFIQKCLRFTIVPTTVRLLQSALVLRTRTNFAYWDCAVIAAALAGGCDVVYTEDVQHGPEFEGVRIVNPFLGA